MCVKTCFNCIFFKETDYVEDSPIEYKNEKGEVWMKELRTKKVERHCPKNPEVYAEWWERVKNQKSTEVDSIDCSEWTETETSKSFNKMHKLLEEISNNIKK